MNESDSEMEESTGIETISTIEEFNLLLDNINKDSLISEINQKVDENDITGFSYYKESKRCRCKIRYDCFQLILYRFIDTIFLILTSLSFIFLFISIVSFIFEVIISFYAVIMMNYVFFISSIVSYTMAPIYQSLSGDWINFIFSFTQVILASPLIAFYIFYILKSVLSLASFISDIPSIIHHIIIIFTKGDKVRYKELFDDYIKDFNETDYGPVFSGYNLQIFFALFFASLGLLALASAIAYVEFCFDKTIIFLGSICYIVNTIQIIMLILPSYLYFFQNIFNIKCKEVEYVISYKEYLNNLFEDFKNENYYKKRTEKLIFESDSFESDSIRNNDINKNVIKVDEKIDKSQDFILIDDSEISDYADEEAKASNNFDIVISMLLQLVTAENYFCLYQYSKTIGFDNHKKCIKVALMYIFLILNLFVIIYDIFDLLKNYTTYFLISIIIRFLFIPLFSYYNITSIIFHRPKNILLSIVLKISSILTVVIAFVIFVCFVFILFYQNKYRIKYLEFVPFLSNYTANDHEMINDLICDYKVLNVSAFDAFGYSLGGYDIKRNKTIFDNQMKTFFKENYTSHISYKVNEFDEHFLFIEYYDSLINTHIFAFRGYNSGPEIAFQVEALVAHYIIPFFEGIVPFYELINDYWLEFYSNFLNSFGLSFFENNNLMTKYINYVIDVYYKSKLADEERVLFTGINCGGIFAKIVGTKLHRKSISFISFPIDNGLFEIKFDLTPSYISLVTNVYNIDGFFSDQEPRYATNIGIKMPIFDKTKFCTSGICEINSKTDNVYRTFCTMSEMCGKGYQFNYYCETIIGKNDFETIKKSFDDN